MDKNNIIEYIKSVIEQITDIPKEEIDENSMLMDDIELSSLDILSLLTDVEEHYQLRIPESAIKSFLTVNDIAAFIEEHTAE